ncbi:MAG: M48 family metallopeptidase [Gammaproteobacteria bacterium]|nr:M48 family metallopeptidase [Gammaproteobacteria bacterium]
MENNPDHITSAITIRVSARAKHACLKVNGVGHVEVVIPKGYNQSLLPEFIAQHQTWLNKTIARMKAVRDPALDTLRPQRIELQAVNETWQVNYGLREKPGMSEYRNAHCDPALWVWNREESEPVTPLLSKWLTAKAKSTLPAWLEQVSEQTGLRYSKLCIRAQKTRWGSCSHKKHINLNRALLFLPEELVRYLMIHELSHTVHLNHSRAYWSLVARWAPQYQSYEKQLNQYSSRIPLWALQ